MISSFSLKVSCIFLLVKLGWEYRNNCKKIYIYTEHFKFPVIHTIYSGSLNVADGSRTKCDNCKVVYGLKTVFLFDKSSNDTSRIFRVLSIIEISLNNGLQYFSGHNFINRIKKNNTQKEEEGLLKGAFQHPALKCSKHCLWKCKVLATLKEVSWAVGLVECTCLHRKPWAEKVSCGNALIADEEPEMNWGKPHTCELHWSVSLPHIRKSLLYSYPYEYSCWYPVIFLSSVVSWLGGQVATLAKGARQLSALFESVTHFIRCENMGAVQETEHVHRNNVLWIEVLLQKTSSADLMM